MAAWASALTRSGGNGGQRPQIDSPANRRRHTFQWRGPRTPWARWHWNSEACGMLTVDVDAPSDGPYERQRSDNSLEETPPRWAQCPGRTLRLQSRNRPARRVGAGSSPPVDGPLAPACGMYGVAKLRSTSNVRADRHLITQRHGSEAGAAWNEDTDHSRGTLRRERRLRPQRSSGVRHLEPPWRAICRGTCNPVPCTDTVAPSLDCRHGRARIRVDRLTGRRWLSVGLEPTEIAVESVSWYLTPMSAPTPERQSDAYLIRKRIPQSAGSCPKKCTARLEPSTHCQAADSARTIEQPRCENAPPCVETKARESTLGTETSSSTSRCRVRLSTTLLVTYTCRSAMSGNGRVK